MTDYHRYMAARATGTGRGDPHASGFRRRLSRERSTPWFMLVLMGLAFLALARVL